MLRLTPEDFQKAKEASQQKKYLMHKLKEAVPDLMLSEKFYVDFSDDQKIVDVWDKLPDTIGSAYAKDKYKYAYIPIFHRSKYLLEDLTNFIDVSGWFMPKIQQYVSTGCDMYALIYKLEKFVSNVECGIELAYSIISDDRKSYICKDPDVRYVVESVLTRYGGN